MSLSCSCKKVTKELAAERGPVLRTGSLRFSVNQWTVPNSLRSDTGDSSRLIPLRCSAR
jgi:hypothetical protein